MKVLHIIAGDLNGGAGKGAHILHNALLDLGVDSNIITNSKISVNDSTITSTVTNEKSKILNMLRSRIDRLPLFFYRKRIKNLSTGFLGFNFKKTNLYREADIIHLHWINNSFVNIKDLKDINKPIIWTLRDMWAMTGGCHYTMDCYNYKENCGNCQVLNSNKKKDLSSIILNRKKRFLPKKIKIVGISKWLTEEAKSSSIFKNFEVSTISNNIDMKEFFPIKKKLAKEILGLNTNKKIILLGATQPKDYYKGFNKYLEAIKLLDNKKYYLCFFGKLNKNSIKTLGFEYKNFGFLYDSVSLRLLYSSADVFVAPSIMDAFGKTIAESMACETPVVCFNATGPKDIITHKVDGYKAIPFESSDLANGIEWIINIKNYTDLSKKARTKILEKFDSHIIAKKYLKLYKESLND